MAHANANVIIQPFHSSFVLQLSSSTPNHSRTGSSPAVIQQQIQVQSGNPATRYVSSSIILDDQMALRFYALRFCLLRGYLLFQDKYLPENTGTVPSPEFGQLSLTFTEYGRIDARCISVFIAIVGDSADGTFASSNHRRIRNARRGWFLFSIIRTLYHASTGFTQA